MQQMTRFLSLQLNFKDIYFSGNGTFNRSKVKGTKHMFYLWKHVAQLLICRYTKISDLSVIALWDSLMMASKINNFSLFSRVTCTVIALPRGLIFDCVRSDTNMTTGPDFSQNREEQERMQLQTHSSSF